MVGVKVSKVRKVVKVKNIVLASDTHFNGKVSAKVKSEFNKKSSGSGLYDLGFNSSLDNSHRDHREILNKAMDMMVDQKMVSNLPVILVKGDMVCVGKKDTGSGEGES